LLKAQMLAEAETCSTGYFGSWPSGSFCEKRVHGQCYMAWGVATLPLLTLKLSLALV